MTEGTNVANIIGGIITGSRPAQHARLEQHVNDDRVKTFIKLTRQVLEEDRIRESELGRRTESTSDYSDPDWNRESELLRITS